MASESDSLGRLFNDEDLTNLMADFDTFCQENPTSSTPSSAAEEHSVFQVRGNGDAGVTGRDIGYFYQDSKTGITIVEERKEDADGNKQATRTFTIDQGYVKLSASINTAPLELADKTLELSIRRNSELSLSRETITRLSASLPDLLFPPPLVAEPTEKEEDKEQKPMHEPKVIIELKDRTTLPGLNAVKDSEKLDTALSKKDTIESVEILFPKSGDREAFRLKIQNMLWVSEESSLSLKVPLTSDWNESILNWILDNHYDANPLKRQAVLGEDLADSINYLKQRLITEHLDRK